LRWSHEVLILALPSVNATISFAPGRGTPRQGTIAVDECAIVSARTTQEVRTMKTSLPFALFLALLAGGAFASLPTSARSGAPASDLQLSVNGRDAVAAGKPGCTRITNRFCAESTKSNCFACR
jgi:hypothetical protein